jgi:hypothetical protein
VPERVYLETTIFSYLTARPSRDLIQSAHQQITRDWWTKRREFFEMHASDLVVEEAELGDPRAAQRRLRLLRDVPLLDSGDDARALARHLVAAAALPDTAASDAAHIAVATVHGMDYLLTWNCRHIANAQMRQRIVAACAALGYTAPILCTPEELMGR